MVDQFIREIKESYGGTNEIWSFDDVAAAKRRNSKAKEKKQEENRQKLFNIYLIKEIR
jgi:hypothetical protein